MNQFQQLILSITTYIKHQIRKQWKMQNYASVYYKRFFKPVNIFNLLKMFI